MHAYLYEVADFIKKIQKKGAYFAIFLLMFPTVAGAYVDPGSVSILLQVVLAFFLGGLLTFKNKVFQFIKSLYRAITFKK